MEDEIMNWISLKMLLKKKTEEEEVEKERRREYYHPLFLRGRFHSLDGMIMTSTIKKSEEEERRKNQRLLAGRDWPQNKKRISDLHGRDSQ